MRALVYEIGGSTIRTALVDTSDLRVLFEARAATPNFHSHGARGFHALTAALEAALGDLAEQARRVGEPDLAVVGYPGPVSPQGIALSSPTLLGAALDRPLNVEEIVGRATGMDKILVMNDVTACGYRYVSEGNSDFCLINVGSGIGNKLFAGGQPLVGPGGRGGEFGHFTMDMRDDAPLCECGGRGHLSGISSGRGVERALRLAAVANPVKFGESALEASTQGRPIDTGTIATAFRAADPWTIEHVVASTRPLAHAMAGLHVATGVECFITVGGFALAMGPTYRDLLVALCAGACWRLGQDWDKMIRLGETGDRDGVLGLAYAAGQRFSRQG